MQGIPTKKTRGGWGVGEKQTARGDIDLPLLSRGFPENFGRCFGNFGGGAFENFGGALFGRVCVVTCYGMGKPAQGPSQIPDPDEEALGPAMRALNPSQRRFAMAAVMFPLAKDFQIARAAGYSDFSHGSLRVAAHRLFHDEKVLSAIKELADKEIRGSALLGIATMKKIARLDGHKDQLKAAAGLVGLAGFTVEQKISVKQTVTDTTDKGIEDRIRRAAAKLLKLGYDPAKLLMLPEPIDAEFQVIDGN